MINKKLYITIALVCSVIFLPTTILLFFGMMPTIACFAVDRSPARNRTICVGMMNFAGCFPFLLDLWTKFGSHSIDSAFGIIADAQTIVVIYLLAAGGYAIDIAVSGIMASLITQKSEARIKKIKKEQQTLIDIWGDKVTGRYRLDDYGFPLNDPDDKL